MKKCYRKVARRHRLFAGLPLAALLVWTPFSNAEPVPPHANDPHRNDMGFFDIHVCHWPDKSPFFLTLFSTYKYNDIAGVGIYAPDGSPIGKLDLERYRIVIKKGKPEKHVFITYIDVPAGAPTGWYSSRVRMKDGRVYSARDYVVIEELPLATNLNPPHNAEIAIPAQLSWDPVPGAKYYKVILKDLWAGTTLLDSKLVTGTRFTLPKGLLKPGGWYRWRVHARDVNEHVLLGDFNHGSLSRWAEFTTSK
jgi:hypothetical protein